MIKAGFPPLLILMRQAADSVLGSSMIVYMWARSFDWNLSAYPSGGRYFNSFAWQLLFTIGAWAALGGRTLVHAVIGTRTVCVASILFVAFASIVMFVVQLGTTGFLPTG